MGVRRSALLTWHRPFVVCAGFVILLTASAGPFQVSPENPQKQSVSSPAAAAPPKDVATPPADAKATPSGIFMKVLKTGAGVEHPADGDCVILSFTAWKRDGSLFSTSGLRGESTVQCLSAAIPGISEALHLMVTGEKRRIWVPAQLAFAAHVAHHGIKMRHGSPPIQADLTFDVELIDIRKAPLTPSNLKTPPQTAFRTPSGVIIDVLKQGTGAKHPSMSSRVTLNYSGWTEDGQLFESTIISGHPAAFLLGTALPGWREGLQYMVMGEKARLWIPAALAYGEHPLERSVPARNLVYDIELMEFE